MLLTIVKYGVPFVLGGGIGVLFGQHNPTLAAAVAKAATQAGKDLAAKVAATAPKA